MYVFIADSSYRDMSALSAGGVAMSVPLGIPMFTRTKDTTDGVNQDVRLQVSNLYTSIMQPAYAFEVQYSSIPWGGFAGFKKLVYKVSNSRLLVHENKCGLIRKIWTCEEWPHPY